MEAKSTFLNPEKSWWLSLFLFSASLLFLYHPILEKLVYDWWHDPNYSHGILLPLFSGYLIWQKRGELLTHPLKASWWGLLVVGVGLLFLLLGWVAGEQFTQRVSFLVVLYGGLIFLLGWPVARKLAFPVGILLLAIPIPYVIYNTLTFPLKLLATKMATSLLQSIGLSVYRDGNIIVLPNTTLEVVDACSGIRSLISLLAICVILAYFVRRPLWKLLFVLASVPVAIGVNVLRIFVTGILSYKFGAEAAEGFFHTFSGLAVFTLSLILVFLIYHLVKDR